MNYFDIFVTLVVHHAATIYTILAFSTAGAFMNRIRGGMWNLPANGILNAVAFGLAVWAISTPLYGLAALVAMLVGQAPGWGRYIGALGDWEENDLEEWWLIDIFIMDMRDDQQAWGAAGLTLRGLFWGGCIGVATLSFLPVVASLTMALCYAFTIQACKEAGTNNPRGDGWEWGEVLFGVILWGSTALAFL